MNVIAFGGIFHSKYTEMNQSIWCNEHHVIKEYDSIREWKG